MNGLQMKYFVLKPKGDDAYARASRKALLAYYREIRKENRELSNDLYGWVVSEIPDSELEEMGKALGDDGQRR